MLLLNQVCILCAVIIMFSNEANASKYHQQSFFEQRKTAMEKMKVTFIKRPKNSKIPAIYYNHPQKFKHNFKRIINEPTHCSQHEKVFLLYVIRTFFSHFQRRQLQRNILKYVPSDMPSKNTVVKLVFLIGKAKNSVEQSLIKLESDKYKDIIQEDFHESYQNLTIKTTMAWKWSVEFCCNTEYVAVINDELFVDQYKLIHYLHHRLSSSKNRDDFAVCYRKGNSKANPKAFIRTRVDMKLFYKGDDPYFCDGVGYVAHINLINKLYIASQTNRILMPDDVWIGVLAEKLNVSLGSHSYLFTYHDIVKKFSHPLYKFTLLMFGITDSRVHYDVSLQILRNLSGTIKLHRQQAYKLSRLYFGPQFKTKKHMTKSLPEHCVDFHCIGIGVLLFIVFHLLSKCKYLCKLVSCRCKMIKLF